MTGRGCEPWVDMKDRNPQEPSRQGILAQEHVCPRPANSNIHAETPKLMLQKMTVLNDPPLHLGELIRIQEPIRAKQDLGEPIRAEHSFLRTHRKISVGLLTFHLQMIPNWGLRS